MKKIKVWLVRRWLHLINLKELQEYTERRFFYEQMNTSYEKLAQSMIDTYFKEQSDD